MNTDFNAKAPRRGGLPGGGVCEHSRCNLCQQVGGRLARVLIGITEQDGERARNCIVLRSSGIFRERGGCSRPEFRTGISRLAQKHGHGSIRINIQLSQGEKGNLRDRSVRVGRTFEEKRESLSGRPLVELHTSNREDSEVPVRHPAIGQQAQEWSKSGLVHSGQDPHGAPGTLDGVAVCEQSKQLGNGVGCGWTKQWEHRRGLICAHICLRRGEWNPLPKGNRSAVKELLKLFLGRSRLVVHPVHELGAGSVTHGPYCRRGTFLLPRIVLAQVPRDPGGKGFARKGRLSTARASEPGRSNRSGKRQDSQGDHHIFPLAHGGMLPSRPSTLKPQHTTT
jgi:hypothetical protein